MSEKLRDDLNAIGITLVNSIANLKNLYETVENKDDLMTIFAQMKVVIDDVLVKTDENDEKLEKIDVAATNRRN